MIGRQSDIPAHLAGEGGFGAHSLLGRHKTLGTPYRLVRYRHGAYGYLPNHSFISQCFGSPFILRGPGSSILRRHVKDTDPGYKKTFV